MPRCKNPTSCQESAAEDKDRPWRRDRSKYIHIQTGLSFNTGASVERFYNIFITKEIIPPKIMDKDLFKTATYAPSKSLFSQQGLLCFIHLTDLTRDTRVPVKKTCFIKDIKFTGTVFRKETTGEQYLDLVVADKEESENEAESSRAGGSRTTGRVTRQCMTRPREEAPEPFWVNTIFDTLTCIRDDVRHLNERMTRFEQSRSFHGPRHNFSGGPRATHSL
ncbi:unnamed protein product [Cuscuta campestris]|uniref:Uncharacterized protein n=1 Tax=Cuscuta campestris TaxID=132261 RepID=A0A484KY43_9ASTE|nr:unnamed protein product [Cuscuta campestris]